MLVNFRGSLEENFITRADVSIPGAPRVLANDEAMLFIAPKDAPLAAGRTCSIRSELIDASNFNVGLPL